MYPLPPGPPSTLTPIPAPQVITEPRAELPVACRRPTRAELPEVYSRPTWAQLPAIYSSPIWAELPAVYSRHPRAELPVACSRPTRCLLCTRWSLYGNPSLRSIPPSSLPCVRLSILCVWVAVPALRVGSPVPLFWILHTLLMTVPTVR